MFDEHIATYADQRAELRELLTATEYAAARRSTLNAHYTDAALVTAMWRALGGLGFTGGRVLEPGCGSGHFIGLAPAGADLVGVELDPVSAAIATALYPRATIVAQSIADYPAPQHGFDAVVGNVPFAQVVLHDPVHNRGRHSLHNHVIIKGLHLTRPGGLLAVITSRFTLDAQDPAGRAEMAELADLVGAVRLPSGAHRRAAGTEAVTDLLVLRRRAPGAAPAAEFATIWRDVGASPADPINQYFLDRPQRVLGELRVATGAHGADTLHVHAPDLDTVAQRLTEQLDEIVRDAVDRGLTWAPASPEQQHREPASVAATPSTELDGTLGTRGDGTFTRLTDGEITAYTPPAGQAAELRALLGLRDTTQALIAAEQTTADDTPDILTLRARLNADYDRYLAEYGPVNRFRERQQQRQSWHVFGDWCERHNRTKVPATASTVSDYLSDLAGHGLGRDLLRRHLDGITAGHTAAQRRQLTKASRLLEPRFDATELGELAERDPDWLISRAGLDDVRLGADAVGAGQLIVTAAPETTDPGLDLDALGLRTTTIVRPPQGGFRVDPMSNLVRALERFDPTTQTARKAEVFTRRVINPPRVAYTAATAEEALSICLDTHSQVDLTEIATLLDLPDASAARAALGELVYDDPDTGLPVWAREYLSGNVRAKLRVARVAAETNRAFEVNVAALEKVVPADLGPQDIEIRLGSWIGAQYVQDFLRHLLEDPTIQVERVAGLWHVSRGRDTVAATDVWGAGGLTASQLTERLLIGAEIRVMRTIEEVGQDGEPRERQVLDAQATEEAKDKARELGDRFADWVWEDTTRAQELITAYNDAFNAEIPPDFTGVALSLPGLSPLLRLREHQLTAVARIVYQPATGLIHDVGAGKTLEMIVGVMERRRRGLCRKPVVVVPHDSIAEQFEREWLRAYPAARLLTATSTDLADTTSRDGRAEFAARAMTGDWDAVIMTKEAFQRIPVHPEAQEAFLCRELDDLRAAKEAAGSLSTTMTKRVEAAVARAEESLKRRLAAIDRDTVGVTLRDTGIDFVVVDEAQTYKNGLVLSALPGLAIDGSARSLDLDMKLAWLAERHGGPRCVLATATPFTNVFSEIYLWLRRLGHQLPAFDVWARTHCTAETFLEMTPGGSLRAKTRMRRVINEPELWQSLRVSSDIKMRAELNLATPALRGGQVRVLTVPAAVEARIFTLDLARRERNLSGQRVGKQGADNHLVIQHDGQLAGLDVRTVGLTTTSPQKAEALAADIHAEWSAARDAVYLRDDGTEHPVRGGLILVFCDESTPSRQWNFYDELKHHLIEAGLPESGIRFVHEATSPQRKADLYAACREGAVSVLIGSTMKMGAGLNIQDRLLGGYEVTPPWRPDISAQARGRVERQGNQNREFFWARVVTAPSMDAKKWEIVAQKHAMFAPLLDPAVPSRTREVSDDESVGLADVMAAATGDTRYREKAELDHGHAALTRQRSAHHRTQQALALTVAQLTAAIPRLNAHAAEQATIATRRVDTRGDAFRMTIDDQTYDNRTDAADALRTALHTALASTAKHAVERSVPIGALGGFALTALITPARDFPIFLSFSDAMPATTETTAIGVALALKDYPARHGAITRLENQLDLIESAPATTRQHIADAQRDLSHAQANLGVPFPHQDRLDQVAARRAELVQELADHNDDLTDDDRVDSDPTSPESLARAARREARRKADDETHQMLRADAARTAGHLGAPAAIATFFGEWFDAIAFSVTAEQRPAPEDAYRVWIDLGQPDIHSTAKPDRRTLPAPDRSPRATITVARQLDATPAAPAPTDVTSIHTAGPRRAPDDRPEEPRTPPRERAATPPHAPATLDAQEPEVDRARVVAIIEATQQWFAGQLDASPAASAYLAERLGGADVVARLRQRGFALGFAPAGWQLLTEHLRDLGVTDGEMVHAGVCQTSRRGGPIDRFRGRITFGIRDSDRAIVGFIGRTVFGSQPNIPKYLNSPNSDHFDKSRLLFGLHDEPDPATPPADRVPVVVEGPLDMLAVAAAEEPQLLPVGLCGTALTSQHWAALDTVVPTDRRRVLALDPNPAGRTAALSHAQQVLDRYPELCITTLPLQLDPAEYALTVDPVEHAAAYLTPPHTLPAVDVLIEDRLARHADTLHWAEGRLAAARDVAALLAPLEQDRATKHAIKAATRIGIDPTTMASELAARRHQLGLSVVDRPQAARADEPATAAAGSAQPTEPATADAAAPVESARAIVRPIIEHTHSGTPVHEVGRDNRAVHDILHTNRFRYSGRLSAWYLGRQQRYDTRSYRVRGLTAGLDAAGIEYELRDTDVPAEENAVPEVVAGEPFTSRTQLRVALGATRTAWATVVANDTGARLIQSYNARPDGRALAEAARALLHQPATTLPDLTTRAAGLHDAAARLAQNLHRERKRAPVLLADLVTLVRTTADLAGRLLATTSQPASPPSPTAPDLEAGASTNGDPAAGDSDNRDHHTEQKHQLDQAPAAVEPMTAAEPAPALSTANLPPSPANPPPDAPADLATTGTRTTRLGQWATVDTAPHGTGWQTRLLILHGHDQVVVRIAADQHLDHASTRHDEFVAGAALSHQRYRGLAARLATLGPRELFGPLPGAEQPPEELAELTVLPPLTATHLTSVTALRDVFVQQPSSMPGPVRDPFRRAAALAAAALTSVPADAAPWPTYGGLPAARAAEVARQLVGIDPRPLHTAVLARRIADQLDDALAVAADVTAPAAIAALPGRLRDGAQLIDNLARDSVSLIEGRVAALWHVLTPEHAQAAGAGLAVGDRAAARDFLGAQLPPALRGGIHRAALRIVRDAVITAASNTRFDPVARADQELTQPDAATVALTVHLLVAEGRHRVATDDTLGAALRDIRFTAVLDRLDALTTRMGAHPEITLPDVTTPTTGPAPTAPASPRAISAPGPELVAAPDAQPAADASAVRGDQLSLWEPSDEPEFEQAVAAAATAAAATRDIGVHDSMAWVPFSRSLKVGNHGHGWWIAAATREAESLGYDVRYEKPTGPRGGRRALPEQIRVDHEQRQVVLDGWRNDALIAFSLVAAIPELRRHTASTGTTTAPTSSPELPPESPRATDLEPVEDPAGEAEPAVAAVTDHDIAAAIRTLLCSRLGDFIDALAQQPTASLAVFGEYSGSGGGRRDESDPGAHDHFTATRRGLDLRVVSRGEQRESHMTWKAVAAWLRPGLDPADIRVLRDASRAERRLRSNVDGFRALGEHGLARRAELEVAEFSSAAVNRMVDRALAAHTSGETPPTPRGWRNAPELAPIADDELPPLLRGQVERIAALSTVFPSKAERAVPLDDVTVGTVFVDFGNSGQPARVLGRRELPESVEFVVEDLGGRSSSPRTTTFFRDVRGGTSTMTVVSLPGSLAPLFGRGEAGTNATQASSEPQDVAAASEAPAPKPTPSPPDPTAAAPEQSVGSQAGEATTAGVPEAAAELVPTPVEVREAEPAPESPAQHWAALVELAAGRGFGVHTTTSGPSTVDLAARTLYIAADQPPLARVVDLALKVGALSIAQEHVAVVPAPTQPTEALPVEQVAEQPAEQVMQVEHGDTPIHAALMRELGLPGPVSTPNAHDPASDSTLWATELTMPVMPGPRTGSDDPPIFRELMTQLSSRPAPPLTATGAAARTAVAAVTAVAVAGRPPAFTTAAHPPHHEGAGRRR